MRRLQPSYTLSPYTTLFRSLHRRADRELRALPLHHACGAGAVHFLARRGEARVDPAPLREVALLDRKSTRLNSSHSQISYAVFCLKKKSITTPHTSTYRRAP